jgi:hypothetical protein
MSGTLYIELAAAAFGVLGTVLLALNGPRAGWGFVAYLASNAGWIAFAWIHSHWGLLAQQLAFTVSSLLGVWVWLVKPLSANWPLGLQFWLHGVADHIFTLAIDRHQVIQRAALWLSDWIDLLARAIYRRFKPAGLQWNPCFGRWEPEQQKDVING